MNPDSPAAVTETPPVAKAGMTLCADCGGHVSIRALSCPHCGAPGPTKSPESSTQAIRLPAVNKSIVKASLLTLPAAYISWHLCAGAYQSYQMDRSGSLASVLSTVIVIGLFLLGPVGGWVFLRRYFEKNPKVWF